MDQQLTAHGKLPSAFTLFKPSYQALMVNIWTFLALMLLPLAIMTIVMVPVFSAGGNLEMSWGLLVAIVSAGLINLLTAPALPYLHLKSVQGQKVTLGEALSAGFEKFWRFYGLSILIGLVILVGFILLIVPGLIMIRRYLLAPYYLFDRDLSIGDAMSKSAAESKPFAWAIWGLIGVSILINIPSVFIILAVVSVVLEVVYTCAPAVRYFQIKEAYRHLPKSVDA